MICDLKNDLRKTMQSFTELVTWGEETKLELEAKVNEIETKNKEIHCLKEEISLLKDYKCDCCCTSFPEEGYLKKHIYTVHEGHKDYKCKSCGKSYSEANQ